MKRNLFPLIVVSSVYPLLACGSNKPSKLDDPSQSAHAKEEASAHAREATDVEPPDCQLKIPKSMYQQRLGTLDINCPPATCGGNSPVVNNFPINGLRTDCVNGEGVWMVAGSLKVPNDRENKCTGKPLTVNPAGYLEAGTCHHRMLIGASFEIRIVRGFPIQTVGQRRSTIVIKRAEYAVVEIEPSDAETVFVYEFREENADSSLCHRGGAKLWRDRAQQEPHQDPTIDHPRGTDFKFAPDSKVIEAQGALDKDLFTSAPLKSFDPDLAIVQHGELFDKLLRVIARGDTGEDVPDVDRPWLSIACIRDSLAKADLYGIARHEIDSGGDRSARDEYRGRRRAALKMLTANHCGTEHYTAEQTEIGWDSIAPFDVESPPPPPAVGSKIEAAWGADQVLCISEVRAFFRDPALTAGTIPPHVFPKICKTTNPGLCKRESGFRTQLQIECGTKEPLPPCDPKDLPVGTKMVSFRPPRAP